MASDSPVMYDAVDPEIEDYLNKTISEEINETYGEMQIVMEEKEEIEEKKEIEEKFLTVEEKDEQQALYKAKLHLQHLQSKVNVGLSELESKKRKREEEEKETKRKEEEKKKKEEEDKNRVFLNENQAEKMWRDTQLAADTAKEIAQR